MSRVAFVLPNLGGGGAERVALNLATAFAGRGHRVDLVLLSATGSLLPLVPSDIRIIDLKAARIRNALLPLARYFRQERPESVHAFMWPVTSLAVMARAMSGKKFRLALSDHTAMSVHYGHFGRARMALLRASLRLTYPLADARLTPSAGAADDLAGLTGLSRKSVTVVSNPIAEQVEEFPARTGGEPLILSVGSLLPAKDHATLIRAFALLPGRPRLVIAGEGPERPRLESMAKDLGVDGRVELPGFVSDPWPLYRSADLFVLSSVLEGASMVLVEAMMAGLRIVSTDCRTGPREMLADGEFGDLVPCGDHLALAEAMSAALAQPEQAHRQRRRAIELGGVSAVAKHAEVMGLSF